MADEDNKTASAAESGAKPKSKLILIVLAVVILILGGGGAYFFLFPKPKPPAEPEKKVTSFIDMKEMMIGIQSEPSQTQAADHARFMKIKITLEVAEEKQIGIIQPLLPRVEDMFQVYLRDIRPSDLQGTAGLFRLKEDLLRRVNLAVQPGHVEAILFKEIMVQ